MEAPGDDNGIILLRDVSEDSTENLDQEHSSATYADKLNAVKLNFRTPEQIKIFEALIEEFKVQPNFFIRPWTKSIMISPSQHHGRYLAFFTALPSGDVRVSFGRDALYEFFPDAVATGLEPNDEDITFSKAEKALAWAKRISATVAGIQPVTKATQSTWNEKDWYFVYGTRSDNREWEDALKYGFVSAGGGDWYSRTVKDLPVGARLFVYIPQTGYVGVGITTGKAVKFEESDFLRGKELKGRYTHENGEPEYMVPINWLKTVPFEEAIYGNGLFASQLSTCKLRHEATLKRLCSEFGVEFIASTED
jgi:hypothetical protein